MSNEPMTPLTDYIIEKYRKEAITCQELLKGFTPEQWDNLKEAIWDLSGYVQILANHLTAIQSQHNQEVQRYKGRIADLEARIAKVLKKVDPDYDDKKRSADAPFGEI